MSKGENISVWMDRALELAEQAEKMGEVPVGALVILENQIISEAWNRREMDSDPCGHAEITALRKAARKQGSWRLSGATLVVTLEPCPMCLAAAQQARVGRVIFGAKDPKGGAVSLGYALHADERLNHRFEVEYLETPRSSEMLTRFFRAKRKK